MVTYCDNCGKLFEFDEKIHKKKIGSKSVEFVICPHCEEIYITNCIDKDLKKMIHKYKKLKQQKRKDELMGEMRVYQDLLISSIDKSLLVKGE